MRGGSACKRWSCHWLLVYINFIVFRVAASYRKFKSDPGAKNWILFVASDSSKLAIIIANFFGVIILFGLFFDTNELFKDFFQN